MKINSTQSFNNDYSFWLNSQNTIIEKIDKLIDAIRLNPFEGIGKPEKLKGNGQNLWSRRITKKDRLVYTIDSNKIVLLSCRGHYD